MVRLRELDFLRGLAILLVLMRHIPLVTYTTNMGWIGVDLFFMLSGFLVSGLLFKEYLRFGNIKPGLFLVRRGFKIYPVYYLFYLLYLFPIIKGGRFDMVGFLADMTFTQNYIWGWGYAYAATWSLAVEEHFYFGFALCLWVGLRYHKTLVEQLQRLRAGGNIFVITVVLILIICLALRYISNILFPDESARHITMTHLRIDSLLCGVLISYYYYFRKETLSRFYNSKKYLLYFAGLAAICWTPFLNYELSFFAKTIGFTLVYISFGIVLITFLVNEKINATLDRLLGNYLVTIIGKIGFCSYSIYIIHLFINALLLKLADHFHLHVHQFVFFIISAGGSILTGMLMTHTIEKYFLRLRERYYPGRINKA